MCSGLLVSSKSCYPPQRFPTSEVCPEVPCCAPFLVQTPCRRSHMTHIISYGMRGNGLTRSRGTVRKVEPQLRSLQVCSSPYLRRGMFRIPESGAARTGSSITHQIVDVVWCALQNVPVSAKYKYNMRGLHIRSLTISYSQNTGRNISKQCCYSLQMLASEKCWKCCWSDISQNSQHQKPRSRKFRHCVWL